MIKTESKIPVLLFDGECAFCNGFVRWMLKHERRPHYYFASLQADVAAPLLVEYKIAPGDLSSLVVIDNARSYRKSDAVLHLLAEMRWPWRLLGVGVLIPRKLRDVAYDFIGKRRYQWWGRADCCIVADPAVRSRIL